MEFTAYFQQALKYLGIRSRSEKEIRDYFKKKKVDPQIIDLIVAKLLQHRFLNDEEFALTWIRSRTNFKPKGERLIRLELQQKGITKDIIDKAFAAFDSAQGENNEDKRDELAMAKEILERKRKKFEPMEPQERFNKAGNLLARRGFDLDEIKKAIEEVFGK